MIKLLGFVPDADPTTPGILTDCTNLIPTLEGMAGAPSLQTPYGVSALAAACKGAAVITKLDGSRRVFAGTASKIYELLAGAWSDKSAAGDYTGNDDTQWSIAQFGDATLFSNGIEAIQKSTTGAFAAISGAPKAEIIFTVGSFVMALNTNDGTAKPDGWHCCASYDDTSWTPSTTTQAASGRLVGTGGEIMAGGALGQYAVAYKSRSMYLGTYVGVPAIWDWQRVIGGTAGCVGKKAWCDLDGTHFFVGEDNFWLFDGTRPIPIGDGVLNEWFVTACSESYKYKIECAFDKPRNLVWVLYPAAGSSTLNAALVYHLSSKRWGRVTVSAESVLEYVTPSITINDLNNYGATIDSLPAIPFDSPYWSAASRSFAIFNTSHQLQTFSGASASSSLTSGDVGDDYLFTHLQRVKVRCTTAPTSATLQHYYKSNSGDTWTQGATSVMDGQKFDLLWSARWHKVKIDFTGPVEITAVGEYHVQDGSE